MSTNSTAYALHYGTATKPLMTVEPDGTYPAMWRIRLLNGTLSKMVNLSRAKDAAGAIAERGPPARNRKLFRWELIPYVENCLGGTPQRVSAPDGPALRAA